MSHSPLWLVRAGEKAAFAKGFRSGNYIAIGWKEVGPVSPDTPDEEIDRLFAVHYPQKDDNTRNVWANQVRQYHREIRVGDSVGTYDPADWAYLIGRIDSDVEWVEHALPAAAGSLGHIALTETRSARTPATNWVR